MLNCKLQKKTDYVYICSVITKFCRHLRDQVPTIAILAVALAVVVITTCNNKFNTFLILIGLKIRLSL